MVAIEGNHKLTMVLQ